MALSLDPQGRPVPQEWIRTGRASATDFRKWLAGEVVEEKKRGKYGQKAGRHADLGNLYLKSKLEANTLRLLKFLGYQLWLEKTPPPTEGKYVAYEWQRFRLLANKGKATERPVFYLPDFALFQDGEMVGLWEAKGVMDARSKRLLRLMGEQHSNIPLSVITAEELEARRTEALYQARRHGTMALEIPNWND